MTFSCNLRKVPKFEESAILRVAISSGVSAFGGRTSSLGKKLLGVSLRGLNPQHYRCNHCTEPLNLVTLIDPPYCDPTTAIFDLLFQFFFCQVASTYLLSYIWQSLEGRQSQLRSPVMNQRLVPQRTHNGRIHRSLCGKVKIIVWHEIFLNGHFHLKCEHEICGGLFQHFWGRNALFRLHNNLFKLHTFYSWLNPF